MSIVGPLEILTMCELCSGIRGLENGGKWI